MKKKLTVVLFFWLLGVVAQYDQNDRYYLNISSFNLTQNFTCSRTADVSVYIRFANSTSFTRVHTRVMEKYIKQ